MVIIGVKEGYREAKMVAMRMACEEVPEPVENVWNAYFAMEIRGLQGDECGNLLFHVEHIGGNYGTRRVLAGRLFHVEHIQ
jgi:hypothetical protein